MRHVATQLEKEMRRFVLVLAITVLIAPSFLCAQQPERTATAPAAQPPDANATATDIRRNANTPRSLMGMVMAVLIESAEQQSAAKRDLAKQESDRNTNTELQPDVLGPPMQASPANEQVAVQSEP